MLDIVLYILVVLYANVLQGITGFAANVLAMPPVAMILGVDVARNTLNVTSFFNVVFMAIWFRKDIDWGQFKKMVIGIMPGIVVGVAIYRLFPSGGLFTVYGAVVAIIGAWYLKTDGKINLPKYALLAAVFGGGIMQGMFMSGGPLLVIYAIAMLKNKDNFRATLSAVWSVTNAFIFLDIILSGSLTSEVINFTLIGMIPMIVATVFGGWLQKRINQHLFLRIVYVLLVLSGLSILVRAFGLV